MLSPKMTQADMDTFLASLGIKSNPFSVEDLFTGRTDEVAWTRMQMALNLDDALSGKLAPWVGARRDNGPFEQHTHIYMSVLG